MAAGVVESAPALVVGVVAVAVVKPSFAPFDFAPCVFVDVDSLETAAPVFSIDFVGEDSNSGTGAFGKAEAVSTEAEATTVTGAAAEAAFLLPLLPLLPGENTLAASYFAMSAFLPLKGQVCRTCLPVEHAMHTLATAAAFFFDSFTGATTES
jgi:hypothetical protein